MPASCSSLRVAASVKCIRLNLIDVHARGRVLVTVTSSLSAVPLQDAQPLKRISSLKTDASKELSTVEILAQSQQAAKEAAEHQAAEHQAQRPPRSLESAQAAGLPPAGGAL